MIVAKRQLTLEQREALVLIEDEWTASAVPPEFTQFLVERGVLIAYTRDEAKADLGLNKLRIDPAMVWGLRGIDPSGEDSVCTLQIKVGGTPKYRTPKGGGSDAVCLPSYVYESWDEALKATKRLFLTEGGKKAACLMSMGELAVSVTGVQCCLPEDKDGNRRPSLYWIYSKCVEYEVEVFIAFDMDIYTKIDVRKALIKLKNYLVSQSISYAVLEWDFSKNRKGIDDYLAFFDTEEERMDELDKLIASPMKAEVIAKWEEELKRKPSSKGFDSGDGKRLPKMSTYAKAEAVAEAMHGKFKYHFEQRVLRRWNGKYWEAIEPIQALSIVDEFLQDLVPPQSETELKCILETVQRKLLDMEWKSLEKKGSFVFFDNGVFNIRTRTFRSHQSDFLVTGVLPYDYTPVEDKPTLELLKEHTPLFYNWAIERFANELEVEAYIACIHACLTGLAAKLQKLFLFEGRSSTGKSTALRFIEALIGKENRESAKLHQLGDPEVMSRIVPAKLVCFYDEEPVSTGLDNLASLTGNDPVSARKLFIGSYTAIFLGTILIAANDYPFRGKYADKMKRRVRAFKMDNVIAKRDFKAEEQLQTELPMVASIACRMTTERATELINGEGGDKVSSVLLDWEYSCVEAVPRFVNEYCAYVPDEYEAITSGVNSHDVETVGGFLSLYDAFKSFCRAGNFQMVNEVSFGRNLKSITDFLEREVGWKIEGTGDRKVKKNVRQLGRRNCLKGLVLSTFDDGLTLADQIREALEEKCQGCQGKKTGCQGKCQGAKPLSDIECQGCQGKNQLIAETEELSLLFEGEVINLEENTQVYPDTSDNLDPVSDVDPDDDPDSNKIDPDNPDKKCEVRWVFDLRSEEWRYAQMASYRDGEYRCQMSGQAWTWYPRLLVSKTPEKPSNPPRGWSRYQDI